MRNYVTGCKLVRGCKEAGIEAFLLLQLLSGYIISCVSFLLGYSLQPWQFWSSMALSAIAAFIFSKKSAAQVIAINFVVFVLTMYTFTYVHVDASICHLPVAHFMLDGWNPVRENSLEAVRAMFASHGMTHVREFSAMHVLVVPKFVHILSAQLQSASGLFTAAAYPMWAMFFALASAAYKFSRAIWGASVFYACSFAALLCCNPIIMEHCFTGLVDYVSYASVVLALLSLVSWDRYARTADLAVFFASLSVALVCKFSALAPSVLLLGYMFHISRRERRLRIAALVSLCVFCFMCIIPYWTSAWWHGSPFYPSHSFRQDAKLMDLTADFIGNDDASKMGYLARFVYAWVSRPLALWGCRLWHSCNEFMPVWRWDFLASGCDWRYCALIWGSLVAALAFARNRVSAAGIVLFSSFFAITTKYIGYPRYVAHVYAAAALLWYNVAYSASKQRVRTVLLSLCAAASAIVAAEAVCKFLRQVGDESLRQRNLAVMAASNRPYAPVESPSWWTYAIERRFRIESLAPGGGNEACRFDVEWPLMFAGEGLLKRENVSLWRTLANWPHPLWDKDEGMNKEPLK